MIRPEHVVAGGILLLVGVQLGRSVERTKHKKRLLGAEVLSVADVRGVLTDEQAEELDGLLSAGAMIVQEQVGDALILFLKNGADNLRRVFVVPATPQDAAPVTADEGTDE